jgi:hypothetical protein
VIHQRHPAKDTACSPGEGAPSWDRAPCRAQGAGVTSPLPGISLQTTRDAPARRHVGRDALQRGRPCAASSHVGEGRASSAARGPRAAQREALATTTPPSSSPHGDIRLGEPRSARPVAPIHRENGSGMQAPGSSAGGGETTQLMLARGKYFVYSRPGCPEHHSGKGREALWRLSTGASR